MGELVADFVLKRLREWGIHRVYRLPGRRDQRISRRLRPRRGGPRVHPGAARGDGGVHGLRPREVHRRDRLLHRDLGPGRDPPAERPLRREARPPAGAGARRPAEALSRWARTTSRRSTCRTLFKDVSIFCNTCAHPAQARHLIDRGDPQRARRARRRDDHLPGTTCRRTDAMESPPRTHGAVYSSIGYSRAAHPAEGVRPRPRGRDPQRVGEGRDPDRPGRAGGRRRGRRGRRAARRRRREGAARPRRAAGRPALRHRPDRPARLEAAQRDGRWAATCLFMIGTSFPYAEWLPKEGQAQVRRDRHRRADDRHPLPGRRPPVGDSKETLQALIPLLERKEDRSWREEIEENVAEWWEILDERAHEEMDPMNPAARALGARATRSPTTRSSPPTPARRRTGGRAS